MLWFFLLLSAIVANAQHHHAKLHRRFAVVNLPMELISLPKELDEASVHDFEMACEVFLQSKLDLAPVNVTKVTVAVGPQTVRAGSYLRLEVNTLIEYMVHRTAAEPIEFERVIVGYYTNEWADLLAFLRLLDSAADEKHFESVYRIDARKEVQEEEWDRGNMVHIPIVSVYVILGVAIVFLLTTSMPLVCLYRRVKLRQEHPSSRDSSPRRRSRHDSAPKRVDSTRGESAAADPETETVHTRNVFYAHVRPPPSLSTMSGTNHSARIGSRGQLLDALGDEECPSPPPPPPPAGVGDAIDEDEAEEMNEDEDEEINDDEDREMDEDMHIDIVCSTDSQEFGSAVSSHLVANSEQCAKPSFSSF